MSHPYLCPNCKTNKTRFNIIEQKPKAVKMDPNTGEITEEYNMDHLDPIHLPYNGPEQKVQCGVCGLIEDEQSFIKRAEYAQNKESL
ncbi:DNA alkylation repair protein [Scopulibacillus cellulosilyticus]|uniref:DNA alkylation repair protein n=1 Tax=Scopulibacillus cellulosilyticus TaxID=2665665 RepID=A0ABW2PTI7_9BACL